VVTFDSALEGTPASIWRGDPRLTDAPTLDLAGIGHLVVISAHPDDETLGAGGLIAECSARGTEVTVVIVTDGAASHPGSPTPRRELAEIRSREVVAAVAMLAPSALVRQLAFADGETREQKADISSALRVVLADIPTDGTLVVAPWRGDGHRDHRVVGEIAAPLAAQLGLTFVEYPIWMWHWASPDDDAVPWELLRSFALDENARRAKATAIAVFESQVRPLTPEYGDTAMLTPEFLQHFEQDTELFIAPEEQRLRADYFDDLYDRHDDPWGFESRWYERRKRSVTVAALPDERYGSVLEIGCSLGLLTLDLATRADRLLAADISQAAVDRARERLAAHPNVTIERRDVAVSYPNETFDLVVLSEVGYYLDLAGVTALLDDIVASLAPGGTVVLCHWRHPVVDYPLSGDAVHAAMSMQPGVTRISRHEERDFLLDVYSRDPRSVAERTGLA
jgi:LmbE family N-acetylglucosaminyl deacetylase/SAM-dependent methyltransferase